MSTNKKGLGTRDLPCQDDISGKYNLFREVPGDWQQRGLTDQPGITLVGTDIGKQTGPPHCRILCPQLTSNTQPLSSCINSLVSFVSG
jgi:hypothetical protein